MTRLLSPSEVRQASVLLSQRETLSREFDKMTAGGKLPGLENLTIVMRGEGGRGDRWEVVNLSYNVGLDRDEIDRKIVVVIVTLVSERIDEIDRGLAALGVKAPPRRPWPPVGDNPAKERA